MVLDIYLEILKSNPSKASEAPSFNASTTSANGHVVVVVGTPGRPTGFTPYPAKDSLFGLFLEQAESWYTGYRAISS